MGKDKFVMKHGMVFFGLLITLITIDHLYYWLLFPYFGVWPVIAVETAIALFGMTCMQKWLLNHISDIHQCEQEDKQQALMKKLNDNSTQLQRYSLITNSIMQISNKILSLGDIDELLQTILEKAIEIIPGAQKGSILIYNGEYLEFRASYGYDNEALKNIKLSIKELFQFYSEDFYEPLIIENAESFNKKHMDSSNFEIFCKSGGLKLNTILSCAINVDNEFYGIINLDNSEEGKSFSEEDKPLIKHLATQIGIALKNAKQIERILYLSRYDSLTGIYNRRYFEELLMDTYQKCKASGSVFSLALIDVDGLKMINDTYGHEAGDLMLKSFSKGLKSHLAGEDILARYGGDEFAIIFIGKTKGQTERTINKLHSFFKDKPLVYCGRNIGSINFSFGVTEFPLDSSEYEELIRFADTRMYRNKKRKKKKEKTYPER